MLLVQKGKFKKDTFFFLPDKIFFGMFFSPSLLLRRNSWDTEKQEMNVVISLDIKLSQCCISLLQNKRISEERMVVEWTFIFFHFS